MVRKNIFQFVFMITLFIMPIMFIHMPRALSFMPILVGIIMSIWWLYIKKEHIAYYPQYMVCVFGVSLLCILSVLWSIEPMGAYKQAIKISAILMISVPLFNLSRSLDIDDFRPYLWLFPAGVALAALLASFELALDMPIYRYTHDMDSYEYLSSAVMNRGVVSTTLAYFVAILFINNMDSAKKLKYMLLAIMSVSVLIMLYLTQCQSAQLAFVVGIFAMFFIPHKMKYSYAILSLIIIAVMFATPWVIELLYVHLMDNAQEIPWLKDGYAGPRVEIWNFVMNYALNNPIYGYGMEATRFVKEFEHDYIYHIGPTILHPHNFSLQLWIDFGLVGIVSASALIASIIYQINKLHITDKKAVIALLIAMLAVGSVGYGMWQSWWIGDVLFLSALSAFIAKKNTTLKV